MQGCVELAVAVVSVYAGCCELAVAVACVYCLSLKGQFVGFQLVAK